MSAVENTARLILMEERDRGAGLSMFQFVGLLRSEHPKATAHEVITLWARYMGIDGRRPTHDPDTGNPL